MLKNKNIFLKKKILIYGLGKSGLSTYQCLNQFSEIFLFDDKKKFIKNTKIKKKLIKHKDLINKVFDYIIISPGIDINRCIISNYLKKNLKKINTDLDIFYSLYQSNKNITITGTNGKSTTAKIFMGDTGSLALGGSLGAVGIITKHEIVLAITGGLFVLEAVSVIVQVVSYKLTGKRVFKMAPIHHHFEKKGWAESTVVVRFWIISIILAMIGLATLKLR